MDTRELLTQLEKLECGLDSFSFTELKSAEATKLKKSFESFKSGLEEKVFGVPTQISSAAIAKPKEQKSPKESQLIANVSHEIRTPLNGIMGFLDLLKETTLTSQQQSLVNAMESATGNLMDVVSELLEFSTIAAGQERFEKVPFNLANLINEVSFLCTTLINKKEVTFMVNYDEAIPEKIIGDPAKLSQVLLNLIGNAIKFVEKGKIGLDVKLKEQRGKQVFLEFVVSDTGIGIANEHLKHIFESYRQAEPATKYKYGGSGLGLSIVKEIIEKQGGNLAVSSTLGVGTTFTVSLPYNRLTATTNSPKIVAKPQQHTIAGRTILVLEDDALTQRLMQDRLSQWGCTTHITASASHGLQLLQAQPIDLILLDMHLPGMSGLEMVAQIRKDKKLAHIPIVVLSGDAFALPKEELKANGIQDFILKPYKSEDLKQKIYANIVRKSVAKPDEKRQLGAVNLQPILEECLGKKELLEELILLFEQNVLEFVGKTKMHLQANNVAGVSFAAHKIKSSLTMLQAKGLIQICDNISDACNQPNSLNALKLLFEEFLLEYPRVEQAIAVAIKNLK